MAIWAIIQMRKKRGIVKNILSENFSENIWAQNLLIIKFVRPVWLYIIVSPSGGRNNSNWKTVKNVQIYDYLRIENLQKLGETPYLFEIKQPNTEYLLVPNYVLKIENIYQFIGRYFNKCKFNYKRNSIRFCDFNIKCSYGVDAYSSGRLGNEISLLC